MTNHSVENGRRNFLLTIAGSIAGLAAGSSPGRVLAQPASGISISTIGAGREGGALGALFVKAGHPVMFSRRTAADRLDFLARCQGEYQPRTIQLFQRVLL